MTRILCLDAGSSSLKFAAYADRDSAAQPQRFASGEVDRGASATNLLGQILGSLPAGPGTAVDATAHRLVFGGARYCNAIVADDAVLHDLETFVAIEPLHLRAQLDLVYAARERYPDAPVILCFDTAFHQRAPAIAKRLPLRAALDPIIARYGFHGLSYEYIASRLPPEAGRTIVAHLGSGASLCAMRDREPIDTTMSFTALGGLMMATRPGDLDPGILLRLMQADGYDAGSLSDLLYHKSGLLGVSGISGDMRTLLASSNPAAREAVDLFVYQLVKHLGALVAVLGGLETIVFTGGIGENAPQIRWQACAALEFLAVRLDEAANKGNAGVISTDDSAVRVLVIPTDENLMLARHAFALLQAR